MFYSSGISVGSGINTAGPLFSSFVLQPGIYQIHWVYGWGWGVYMLPDNNGGRPVPQATLNGSPLPWIIIPPGPSYFNQYALYLDDGGMNLGGGLARVSQPNTVLQFMNVGGKSTTGYCELIITRLQ